MISVTLYAQTAAGALPDYQATLAATVELESGEKFAQAYEQLVPLAAVYRDDYELFIRLGWLAFKNNDWLHSFSHYQQALVLSLGTSSEARLGVGWALQRQGLLDRAKIEFDTIERLSPGHKGAAEGLAMLNSQMTRPVRVWAGVTIGAAVYGNHPNRQGAGIFGVSGSVQLFDRFVFQSTWRFLNYDYASNTVTAGSYQQNEWYASVGYIQKDYSLKAHFGYLWDTGNTIGPAYTLGGSARFSLLGDLWVEGSGTVFKDYAVGRIAGRWDINVHRLLSVGPSIAMQYGNGVVSGTFGAALTLKLPQLSVTLDARYGEERRPTYLNDSLMYASNDRVRGVIGLTGRMPIGQGLSLSLGYQWQRLVTGLDGSSTEADAHILSAGFWGSW